MNTHQAPLDPSPAFPPLHDCPHGCGAQLGVSSRTEDGERGLCGQCRLPTVFEGGRLRPGISPALARYADAAAQIIKLREEGYREVYVCNPLTGIRHLHAHLTALLMPRVTSK